MTRPCPYCSGPNHGKGAYCSDTCRNADHALSRQLGRRVRSMFGMTVEAAKAFVATGEPCTERQSLLGPGKGR